MPVRVGISENRATTKARFSVAALTLILLTTACAGNEPEQVASLEGASSTTAAGLLSVEDAALQYAVCMRDNGVADFEDPRIAADGSIEWSARGKTDKAALDVTYAAATEICKSAFDGSVDDKADLGIEKSDTMYELAVCMREHGFDMPDPDATGGFGEFNKDSPEFEAAFEECGGIFGGGSK